MKEPPITPMNRNGPTSFVTQGQQQGAVMMVYGLDNDTSNTDKLFNLVCLYGNVARVRTIYCIYMWPIYIPIIRKNERSKIQENIISLKYKTSCTYVHICTYMP